MIDAVELFEVVRDAVEFRRLDARRGERGDDLDFLVAIDDFELADRIIGRFEPFDEFVASVPAEFRDAAYQHIARSHSMSVEKGRRVLGYRPEYSSLAAVAEAVEWLRKDGLLGDDVPPVLA